ncbi:hypothetical protein GTW20_10320 [Nocardiopsis alba]|uniref:TPR repeat domain-containing protein n=1 Tax=Nocardiopsis alba TaxID=53437 RepID=A0A7K2IRQ2_9ACTN|nr:hypothetical protein [Nocardiopsis alba]MYR32658.1 hypothetical protein [Nocardiopsis alba]
MTFNGETSTAMEVSSSTGLYSTRSFNLLMNSDPDFNPAAISKLAEDMIELEARILGRAHDLGGTFDESAQAFTDLIQWSITGDYTDDLDTWMDAAASMRFCAAITEEWYDAAKAYKDERLRIINRWNNEAPALAEGLDKAPPMISLMGTKSPAEKAEADLDALKSELEGEEAEAYRTLDSTSITLGDDLRNGPTPEAIGRLMQGKYITWSYFNLGGDVKAIPIDIDPEDAGATVADFSENPEDYDIEDIEAIIAVVSNISARAMDGREGQEGTSNDSLGEELLFLEVFYDVLEDAGPEGDNYSAEGMLGIAEKISANEDIDESLRERLLASMGNGVLVLSDEAIGGGYDRIPESVRNISEGKEEEDWSAEKWTNGAEALALIFDDTMPGLRGGEQLSVNLAQTVADHLDYDGDRSSMAYAFESSDMEALISVASKNEDAVHAILTGEGDYQHPEHGLDAEMTFRALYSFDWEDDGLSAASMTDWIVDQADREFPLDARAGEAMAALMELFGKPSFSDAISGTGNKVMTDVLDEDGKVIKGDFYNAPASLVNPDLAWAWSDLFSTYINEFSSSEGLEVGSFGQLDAYGGTAWTEDGGLVIDPSDRASFLQQIMGDGNSAARVHAETLAFGEQKMYEYVDDRNVESSGEGFVDTSGAMEAGNLRGLVDTAMEREIELRNSNNVESVEYLNKVRDYGVDMFGSAVSEVPYPGLSVVSEGIKIGVKENFNIDAYEGIGNPNNRGAWELEESFKLAATRSIAGGDDSIMERISRDDYSSVVEHGGESYIPADVNEWEVDNIPEAIRNNWRIATTDESGNPLDWGISGISSDRAWREFEDAYSAGRQKTNEESI